MQKSKVHISRLGAVLAAAILVVVAAVPIILNGIANAGIPTARSITLSTSAGGATDVTYTVGFTTDQGGSSSNVNGVVIEFCDNSPIIGDSTCTAPTGFDTKYTTGLALGSLVGLTSLTIDTTNSTVNKLVLTGTNTGVASATAVTIPLGAAGGSDGVTNPTAGNHTFYARILTFTTAGGAQGYTSGTPGSYVDAGGVALSTANQLQITAKVQERLSFCVYISSCTVDTAGGARTSAFNLGNTNGVLDPAGPFVDKTAEFDISTNALSGATVVMKGDTLVSGAFDIAEIGGTAATSSSGTEQFGMCLFESTGSGLTISAPYNNGGTPANCNSQTSQTSGTGATGGAGTATFAFDTAATTAASGDQIASKAAGTTSTGTMVFLGNVAFTTEAGIYQTTLTYIATGTY